MTICTWCLTNAGRTHAKRDCCQLRALAQMPSDRLAQHVAKWDEAAKDELRPRLIAEKKRLREMGRVAAC